MKFKQILTGALVAASLLVAGQVAAQERLTVWWNKGFYPAEDAALATAIQRFEEATNIQVDLSKFTTHDVIPKTVAALAAGNPPDVAYGDLFDFQVTGRWAYENKLADLSSVINPIRARFAPQTVETTFLHNSVTNRRAYYAFPLRQQTIHIHYWVDMLTEAGLTAADIPTTWTAFWDFWCVTAQRAHRRATGERSFGVGQPMGVGSSDAFYSFLTFADAHNVRLVDDNGKLLVGDPKVRQGLINAMTDYVSFYKRGCTPPSAPNWRDPDNNVAFHNQTTMMTHNATISIVAKWLDDAANPALTAEQRATAAKNYAERIRTVGFPSRPDGTQMRYRAAVKTGVVFREARNKENALRFVAFLLEDRNLTPLVEGSLGRWFPVTIAGQQSAFWQADPHRRTVHSQFAAGTIPFEFTKNFRFTTLNMENVWARAMNRVTLENIPVDRAVDEMIARIKEVAG